MNTENINKENIQDTINRLQTKFMSSAEMARNNLDEVNRQAVAFVKEHPLVSVAGALAAGYLIGRVLSHWR